MRKGSMEGKIMCLKPASHRISPKLRFMSPQRTHSRSSTASSGGFMSLTASSGFGREESKELIPDVPPFVSAESWCIVESKSGEALWGKNMNEKKEIASLTKTMTALVASKLLKIMGMIPEILMFPVSALGAWVGGTSANLHQGQKMYVFDLLHGLLLPSGNDAAVTLAEGFGRIIYDLGHKNKTTRSKLKKVFGNDFACSTSDPYKVFVGAMNKLAGKLNLRHTTFSNPHGLSDKANKSSAHDICKLASIASKEELIRNIVKKQFHQCLVFNDQGEGKPIEWINTNKLLKMNEGYDGFKTGITPNAGPCLIGGYSFAEVKIFIALLGSKSPEARWIELPALVNWAETKIKLLLEKYKDANIGKKLALYCREIYH